MALLTIFLVKKARNFGISKKIECFDLMNPLKDCNFVVNLTLYIINGSSLRRQSPHYSK